MTEKNNFGENFDCEYSHLKFPFSHCKVSKLYDILHDAAGAVRAHSGKALGYCYMVGRGLNSCLLGHVTGLLFCLKTT